MGKRKGKKLCDEYQVYVMLI